MANKPTIPSARVPIVPNGVAAREWYRFFSELLTYLGAIVLGGGHTIITPAGDTLATTTEIQFESGVEKVGATAVVKSSVINFLYKYVPDEFRTATLAGTCTENCTPWLQSCIDTEGSDTVIDLVGYYRFGSTIPCVLNGLTNIKFTTSKQAIFKLVDVPNTISHGLFFLEGCSNITFSGKITVDGNVWQDYENWLNVYDRGYIYQGGTYDDYKYAILISTNNCDRIRFENKFKFTNFLGTLAFKGRFTHNSGFDDCDLDSTNCWDFEPVWVSEDNSTITGVNDLSVSITQWSKAPYKYNFWGVYEFEIEILPTNKFKWRWKFVSLSTPYSDAFDAVTWSAWFDNGGSGYAMTGTVNLVDTTDPTAVTAMTNRVGNYPTVTWGGSSGHTTGDVFRIRWWGSRATGITTQSWAVNGYVTNCRFKDILTQAVWVQNPIGFRFHNNFVEHCQSPICGTSVGTTATIDGNSISIKNNTIIDNFETIAEFNTFGHFEFVNNTVINQGWGQCHPGHQHSSVLIEGNRFINNNPLGLIEGELGISGPENIHSIGVQAHSSDGSMPTVSNWKIINNSFLNDNGKLSKGVGGSNYPPWYEDTVFSDITISGNTMVGQAEDYDSKFLPFTTPAHSEFINITPTLEEVSDGLGAATGLLIDAIVNPVADSSYPHRGMLINVSVQGDHNLTYSGGGIAIIKPSLYKSGSGTVTTSIINDSITDCSGGTINQAYGNRSQLTIPVGGTVNTYYHHAFRAGVAGTNDRVGTEYGLFAPSNWAGDYFICNLSNALCDLGDLGAYIGAMLQTPYEHQIGLAKLTQGIQSGGDHHVLKCDYSYAAPAFEGLGNTPAQFNYGINLATGQIITINNVPFTSKRPVFIRTTGTTVDSTFDPSGMGIIVSTAGTYTLAGALPLGTIITFKNSHASSVLTIQHEDQTGSGRQSYIESILGVSTVNTPISIAVGRSITLVKSAVYDGGGGQSTWKVIDIGVHGIADHVDTTATGENLNTLTGGAASDASALFAYRPDCLVTQSATLTWTYDTAYHNITFDTGDIRPSTWYTLASNQVTIVMAGDYVVEYSGNYQSGTTAVQYVANLRMKPSGAEVTPAHGTTYIDLPANGFNQFCTSTGKITCAAGDYFYVRTKRNAGGTTGDTLGIFNAAIKIRKVG